MLLLNFKALFFIKSPTKLRQSFIFYVSCYIHWNLPLSTLFKQLFEMSKTKIENRILEELAVQQMHTVYVNPVI